MSEPFLGEIRPFAITYAPKGWAPCDGALLPINQNQALFALLGTMYGGNGQTTFALPDLRGRTPMHLSGMYPQGTQFGQESVTLTVGNLPPHIHQFNCTAAPADNPSPAGNMLAAPEGNPVYGSPASTIMPAVGNAGGSQPVSVRQPYSVIMYCIALQGIFPSRD